MNTQIVSLSATDVNWSRVLETFPDIDRACRYCHSAGVVPVLDYNESTVPGFGGAFLTGSYEPCCVCGDGEIPY